MRDIERDLLRAIRAGRAFRRNNTEYDPLTGVVKLSNNAIANMHDGQWTMAGWGSETTRSRLNALFHLLYADHPEGIPSLTQRRGEQRFTLGDLTTTVNTASVYSADALAATHAAGAIFGEPSGSRGSHMIPTDSVTVLYKGGDGNDGMWSFLAGSLPRRLWDHHADLVVRALMWALGNDRDRDALHGVEPFVEDNEGETIVTWSTDRNGTPAINGGAFRLGSLKLDDPVRDLPALTDALTIAGKKMLLDSINAREGRA